MADAARGSSWVRVWTRAVVRPAARRFLGTWLGLGIVAAVIFGPTAMQPSDLTGLALHAPTLGVALGVTWILLFLPAARILLRADGGRFLRSLPHPRAAPPLIAVAALVVLQLPWLALWWLGEGPLGLAIVALTTLPIATLAVVHAPAIRPRFPHWRSDGAALRGIYVRAVRRRAGDATVRAAGFAVLAGVAGGLIVRNNHLIDPEAAVLAASVIALVLVPAQAGLLMVLVDAHRQTAWLAATTGVSHATRIAALATVIAGIDVGATGLALAVDALAFGATASLVATALGIAVATALGTTLAVVRAAPSPAATGKVVLGAIVVAAVGVLCLGILGTTGALAALALGGFAVLRC